MYYINKIVECCLFELKHDEELYLWRKKISIEMKNFDVNTATLLNLEANRCYIAEL